MEEFFARYGTVVRAKFLPKNERFGGKFWIALDSAEAVEKCLEELGETVTIGDQEVTVLLSAPQENRKPKFNDNSKRTCYVGNLSFRVEDW